MHLFNVEGEDRVATVLLGVWLLLCAAFPGRLRALYALGSRVDGTAATVSDVDGCVVFRGRFEDDDERQRAETLLAGARLVSPYRLDLALFAEDEEAFLRSPDVRIKLGGRLVHGEDVRDRIELPAMSDYQEAMRAWPEEFIPILHDQEALRAPLAFPDPEGEFFGYDRKRAERWYPPGVTQGTKELVATVCWTASARLALEAETMVATRGEGVRLYREKIADEWADLVEDVYRRCKEEWDYAVPEAAADRAALRALCRRTLDFCNDYARRYTR